MQFGFTEAQEMFRTQMQSFVKSQIVPGAKERAKQNFVPQEVIKKLVEKGITELFNPDKYGGQIDLIIPGIAVEEIAKGDIMAATLAVSLSLTPLIISGLPDEVKDELLPRFIAGEKRFCMMATEPDCGSDIASMKTRAARDGDFYIINGEKTSVTDGMRADAGYLVAKTDFNSGAKGVTGFFLPLNLPGISRAPISDMGWTSLGRASITLNDVRLPAKYRLGEEGRGFYRLMEMFDNIRVLWSLIALGAAQASLEEAVTYAKQRTAFGKPIAKFEGVSFKIAENAIYIEAARLLCYRTLSLRNQGLPTSKESAMCKCFCPQVAVRVCHDALITLGHIGYSQEHRVEQRLRDVIGYEIADGTPEIQKLIITREIFGKEFLPY